MTEIERILKSKKLLAGMDVTHGHPLKGAKVQLGTARSRSPIKKKETVLKPI